MEGASTDLRTGLPRQMIEVHEAMRLLVVVETKTDLVTASTNASPCYRSSSATAGCTSRRWTRTRRRSRRFVPGRAGCAGRAARRPCRGSHARADWYLGHREPLSPALIALEPTVLERPSARPGAADARRPWIAIGYALGHNRGEAGERRTTYASLLVHRRRPPRAARHRLQALARAPGQVAVWPWLVSGRYEVSVSASRSTRSAWAWARCSP